MSSGRPLSNYQLVREFLVNEVNIKKMISDKDIFSNNIGKKTSFFSKSEDEIENYIIRKVYDANCDMDIIFKRNTLEYNDFRLINISNQDRKKFRERIAFNALENEILDDENNISQLVGGLLPKSKKVGKERMVFYIIGLPASGKSYLANIISEKFNCIVLDSDIIKRKIPEFDSRNGASLVHAESKEIIEEIRNICIEKECNIIEPIIGDDFNELNDLISFMQEEKNYNAVVIYTKVPSSVSLYRATKRFIETDRYVPINKIIDSYGDLPDRTYKTVKSMRKDIPSISIDTSKEGNKKTLISFLEIL